jgi:hypothetical protein
MEGCSRTEFNISYHRRIGENNSCPGAVQELGTAIRRRGNVLV